MKAKIARIAASLVLFLCALLIPALPELARLGLYLAAYGVIAYPVLWKAVRNILRGRVFDENFLMAVASLGALIIGEYPEAVAVMIFYQIGEMFESYAVSRSRRSIKSLMEIGSRQCPAQRRSMHGRAGGGRGRRGDPRSSRREDPARRHGAFRHVEPRQRRADRRKPAARRRTRRRGALRLCQSFRRADDPRRPRLP